MKEIAEASASVGLLLATAVKVLQKRSQKSYYDNKGLTNSNDILNIGYKAIYVVINLL